MNVNFFLIIVVLSATLIWLGVLTYFLVRASRRYQNLNDVLNSKGLNLDQIADINKRVSFLEKENLSHIQKVSTVRFNPFGEAGGDNSFIVCLLDGNHDGVLLTGLHTREKTRLYVKKVENGKSKFDLSKEELKAIHEAIVQK